MSGSSPIEVNFVMKIGDKIRVVKIPISAEGVSDEMGTQKLFEDCLGKVFEIKGFDDIGHIELHVGKLRGEKDYLHSVWIEPEFVEPV